VTGAGTGGPTDALKDFFGAVNVLLTDPRTEDQPLERLRAIRRHVDDVFDFREAAMLALGREWTARTPIEQSEFVALFADLLERSFVGRVAGRASVSGGVKVSYLGESVNGDSATVDSALAARDGNQLRLEFRMVRRAERWLVRDVVMDGVGTMANYHAQFQRIVRDSSWPELVGQLRAKVGAPAVGVQVAAAAPVVAPPGPAPAPVLPQPVAPPLRAAPAVTIVASPAPVVSPLPPAAIDRPAAGVTHAIARNVAAVVTPGFTASEATTATLHLERPGVAPNAVRDVQTRVAPRTSRGQEAGAAMLAAVPPSRPTNLPQTASPAVTREPATSEVWIQVGAFKSTTTAGRVATQVNGEILVVAPRGLAGGGVEPLLRVRVGPFSDRVQATARLRELRALGYQPFIAD
jgi:phospholipid transport system substrate-binding protein